MGSESLRYHLTDLLYQFQSSAGQSIIKRLNQIETMVSYIAASRRGDPAYKDIEEIKGNLLSLRERYVKAFDLSPDDLPERAEFERGLYLVLEDTLSIATEEKLITGAIAGTYLSDMGRMSKGRAEREE